MDELLRLIVGLFISSSAVLCVGALGAPPWAMMMMFFLSMFLFDIKTKGVQK